MITRYAAVARTSAMDCEHAEELCRLEHRINEHKEHLRCESDVRVFAYASGLLSLGVAAFGAYAWHWQTVAGSLMVTVASAINSLLHDTRSERARNSRSTNGELWNADAHLRHDFQVALMDEAAFKSALSNATLVHAGYLAPLKQVNFDKSLSSRIFRVYYRRLAHCAYQAWQEYQQAGTDAPKAPLLKHRAASIKRLTASFLAYSCRPYLCQSPSKVLFQADLFSKVLKANAEVISKNLRPFLLAQHFSDSDVLRLSVLQLARHYIPPLRKTASRGTQTQPLVPRAPLPPVRRELSLAVPNRPLLRGVQVINDY